MRHKVMFFNKQWPSFPFLPLQFVTWWQQSSFLGLLLVRSSHQHVFHHSPLLPWIHVFQWDDIWSLSIRVCHSPCRRFEMDRDPSEARFCAECNRRHGAEEGDLWAESSMLGLRITYFAFMDGKVYDITGKIFLHTRQLSNDCCSQWSRYKKLYPLGFLYNFRGTHG